VLSPIRGKDLNSASMVTYAGGPVTLMLKSSRPTSAEAAPQANGEGSAGMGRHRVRGSPRTAQNDCRKGLEGSHLSWLYGEDLTPQRG
jgi:hypothetical protein